MSFRQSTAEEVREAQAIVDRTREFIRELSRQGKKVHIVWDIDHVLVSGRSDDIFGLLGFSVERYFQYEERLITECLEPGLWLDLARKESESNVTQDLVTARSSFLALRVSYFLLRYRLSMRWQLFVGHQSKGESYRIILSSFAKDPNTVILNIDDAVKHIDAFYKVAAELNMQDRCVGILAPQIRLYDTDELMREIDAVLNKDSKSPYLAAIRIEDPCGKNRTIQVTPDPYTTLLHMFQGADIEIYKLAIVEQHRAVLEKLADQLAPTKEKTNDLFFMLYELMREP